MDAPSLRKLLNSTSEAANGTRSAASGPLSTPKQTVDTEPLDPSAHGTPAAAAAAATAAAANLASKTLEQSAPSSAAGKQEASEPEPAAPLDAGSEPALLTATTQPANDSGADTKQPAASQDAAAAAKKPPPSSCLVRVALCQRQAGLPLGRAVPAQLPPISTLHPWPPPPSPYLRILPTQHHAQVDTVTCEQVTADPATGDPILVGNVNCCKSGGFALTGQSFSHTRHGTALHGPLDLTASYLPCLKQPFSCCRGVLRQHDRRMHQGHPRCHHPHDHQVVQRRGAVRQPVLPCAHHLHHAGLRLRPALHHGLPGEVLVNGACA